MKKWLIIFCLIVFPVFAQEISDFTFSENNPNLIHNNETRSFNGGSFVYIQGISDKPQPKTWMDNIKIKLFGSMEIPDGPDAPHLNENSSFTIPSESGIPTKDFFGSTKEIKYTPHTSNWDFIIQPMDKNTISIQENIQFLLTEDMPIVRSWPISKKKITWIKKQIDGQYISNDPEKEVAFLDLGVLSAGLHTINLHYTLSLPIHNDFILPLANNDWPLVTDAFSGVILNGKVNFSQPHFLLGQNLQEIPENFIFQSDKRGNIFFKNTHILPAFTQIQLSTKTTDIFPQQKDNAPFLLSGFLIFIIAFIILTLYLIFSGLELYFSSLTYLLKKFRHTSKNGFKNWLFRMGEIIIGCVLLLFFTFLISYLFHLNLSYTQWLLLIVLTIAGITCLDIFIFYPKQQMIHQLHQNREEK